MLKNRQECIQTLGSDFAIANAVSAKELYRLDRGIYSDRPYVPFVEIAAKRYPNAVVTLDSAFYYQRLTDVVPDVLHLATDRKASRIVDRRICQHFVPTAVLHVGETRVTFNSSTVLTYDLERLAIEVVRMRTKIPFDYYKEVVNALRGRVHEMYPAKIDDYLVNFPYRDSVAEAIRKEIF